MSDPISPRSPDEPTVRGTIARLRAGRYAEAYADALVLLARRPQDAAVVDLLARTAACVERQEEALALLRRLRERGVAPELMERVLRELPATA